MKKLTFSSAPRIDWPIYLASSPNYMTIFKSRQCCGSASRWCGSGSCLSLWSGSGSNFSLRCGSGLLDPAFQFEADPCGSRFTTQSQSKCLLETMVPTGMLLTGTSSSNTFLTKKDTAGKTSSQRKHPIIEYFSWHRNYKLYGTI